MDKIKTGSKEIRMTTSKIEIRSDSENEKEYIEGYALKFDRLSERLGWAGWFREKISRHALVDSDMSNVTALFNHDESQILGRTKVNLELVVDAIGLRFKVDPTKTSYAQDLMENIRSGIINQCSFAFTVSDDEDAEIWEDSTEDGVHYIRTIKKIGKLYDVSVVTTPAYSDTEAVIGARSKQRVDDIKYDLLRQKDQQVRDRIILEAEAYR